MRLSRILMLMGALALAAAPAAAQGKAIGKPAGVGKPTTTTVKGASGVNGAGAAAKGKSADAKAGTLAKGKSADHAKGPKTTATDPTITDTDTTVSEESKGRGQLPLGEKIAMNETLTARLEPLLVGTTLTTATATEGWRNQGQFVAAMNAAQREGISFEALRTEMVTNQKSLPDAIAAVKATTTTTTTTTTTPAPPAP